VAEEQVEAVERRLRQLNPGFRGKVDSDIHDGKVRRPDFLSDCVTDISPVRALKELDSLDCGGSTPRKGRLTVRMPLRGLHQRWMGCADPQVSDLEPRLAARVPALPGDQSGQPVPCGGHETGSPYDSIHLRAYRWRSSADFLIEE
jgi:hypothetical protein